MNTHVNIRLVLPYPPSANRYWRNFRGNVVTSAEARSYKLEVAYLAKHVGIEKLGGPVVVFVDIYRPRRVGDLDNRLKVLLDALQGVAYDNDSQVVEVHARRFDDKQNPRAELEVRVADA